MSELDKEIEKELEQGLIPIETVKGENLDDEYLGDLKMQAQEYGQKIQEAAEKAQVFANEKLSQAGEKFNELKDKDPKEILEDAKDYAKEKPGKTILISAAVGLVVGFLLKRK